MSGHNKWSKIKNKKGDADSKRAAVFQKLSREIFMAAKNGGGDPSMNSALRLILDKAKAANMPKDNINRAIKKATDAGDTTNYDEITYEGYGPGGVGILVHTLTDNKNRTDTNVHVAFTRNFGKEASSGAVAYMFKRKGYLAIGREDFDLDEDTMLEKALEAGAEDLKISDDVYEIFTAPEDFSAVKAELEADQINFAVAEVTMIPDNTIEVSVEQQAQLEQLIDKLEEDDDVSEVFTTAEFAD